MNNLGNYDDFNSKHENNNTDIEQHHSRRAKKQREAEAASESTAAAAAAVSGKKYKLNKRQFIKFVACVIVAVAVLMVAYASVVIIRAPKIQTDNIYSLLSQSSVLYDDKGEIIDSVSSSEKRTIVEISQIPDHVQKAFIALEDKTFEKHHGFNIVRIFGAIKDAVFHGGFHGRSN